MSIKLKDLRHLNSIVRARRRGSRVVVRTAPALIVFGLLAVPIAGAQVNVTTQQNDIARTGQNLNETSLTTSNVNSTQFGKLFARPVAGAISAQPLYLSGVTINGATHNVVFVATRSDVVYAFDADSNTGANASPLWSASMLSPAHGASAGTAIYGSLGITSTPVIDPVSNTLYVVSATLEGGQPIYRLHALDVTTGSETLGGPVAITASASGTAADGNAGTVTLTPRNHNQRAGLLLLNGIVYLGFGAYTEGEETYWHGWILGYDAGSLVQTGVFCMTCNGNGGGIWMSGNGLAADQLDPVNDPYGRMFAATGNGDFTATFPYGGNMDFGDSVVDLDLTNGVPNVTDDFTPNVQSMLAASDGDQGSGGVMILPAQTAGAYPNLLVQAGKSGTLYLLDRDNLGGYSSTTNQVVQALAGALGNPGPAAKAGVWSSPAYWNGNVYYWGVYDNLKQFPLVNGLLAAPPIMSAEVSAYPASTPSISANGNTQGIVWSIDTDAAPSAAILEAHDAGNVATTLYSSASNAARDTAGPAVLFTVPTIVNGMVYVGTANQLDVYGLFSSSQTSTPMIAPGSQSFIGSLDVTITDATPGAAIYYTTNGSSPTTASMQYAGPIVGTSNQTINAIAAAAGIASSYQAGASYTQSVTATPTFSPAAVAYPAPQPVTISDSTAGAAIHYTTDGTTPTIASSIYSGPITLTSTGTLRAIAAAPGYAISGVASAAYTISSSNFLPVDDSAGFPSAVGLNFAGTATLANNALQLSIAGKSRLANAVWFTTPVNVQQFTTDFYFQEASATADGFTFALQNAPAGLYALGGAGSGLGYQGIASSVAVKFDLFDNAGEGVNSTGFYTNGAAPTVPAVDLAGSGVNLHGADILHAHITYDGATLTLSVIDTATSASFTTSTAIDIPATVGGNTAYAGFTAGTSSTGATQTILNWTYMTGSATTPMAATPTFAPGPGAYSSAQSVTIVDATPGVTVYYTTDGTMPTLASSVFSNPVSVSGNETLNAIAAASGYTTSAVGSAPYQIAASAPTFSPGAGTYSSPQSVAINDPIGGATIHYTSDGTTPTAASPVYSAPIRVSANGTLKAIAVASGYTVSAVGSAAYKIEAAVPTFSPGAGTYSSPQSVTIADATPGATIYYTTNGTAPSPASSAYSAPVGVSAKETLKAIAAAGGYSTSDVASAAYKFEAAPPTFSPGAGTYPGAQSVTITDATPGAAIYYTTNGTTPSTASSEYSAPISVSAKETLKAIAAASGYSTSDVASAAYKIEAAAPTFSPGAGTYSGAQSVTITDATPGATIYYTTNGTTPSTSSSVYSVPISVGAKETLKAIAVASGYSTSDVAIAAYKIDE